MQAEGLVLTDPLIGARLTTPSGVQDLDVARATRRIEIEAAAAQPCACDG